MLGNSTIKNYINKSHAIDIKPRVFLEFNGNDYGNPYFLGTGERPPHLFEDFDLELLNRPYSPAPTSNYESGLSIAISPETDTAYLIDVGPGGNSFYEHGYYATAPSGVKNIKFNMFLKSDYANKIISNNEYLESFDVVFYVYAINAAGIILKTETVTKTVTVDSINWKPVSILFSNPDSADEVDRIVLNIFISMRQGEKIALIVDKLCYAEISDYEVFVKDRLPLDNVFKINRTGEFLVDTPVAERPIFNISGDTFHQQPTQVHMSMAYALGPKYESIQRSVTPYQGNPNSYYVSGTEDSSREVWALYKNKIKTNKIVIKTNALAVKPNNFIIRILDSVGNWSDNLITTQTFDNNGLLILYYNGIAWTATPPDTDEYPQFDLTSGINSGNIVIGNNIAYKEIRGIYLNIQSLSTTTDFNDLPISSRRLELIEISPRLEIDVTNLVNSLSIKKEITENNSNLLFSGITSNSYNIQLSNIGILQSDGSYKNPLNTNSIDSPIYKLLRRMVKVRGGWDIDLTNSETGVNGTKQYLPSFVGYLDSWDLTDTLTLNSFDSIKLLQNMKTPPLYLNNKRIAECLYSILDAAGFGEANINDISDFKIMSRSESDIFIPSEKITHFWTSEDNDVSTTINNLCNIFQFGLYCDEYGSVRIKSLYTFNKEYKQIINNLSNIDMYIQDYNDINSLSNIISDPNFYDADIPSKLIIKYYDPHTPTDLIVPKKSKDKTPNSSIEDPKFKNVTNIVWSPDTDTEILPIIEIGTQGINGIHQNWIPYNVELTQNLTTAIPYSSHLLIDQEIVSYDGVEYEFRYTLENNAIYTKKIKIKSPEEVDAARDAIISENAIKEISYGPTGKLVNVKRGLFGTVASRHIRKNSTTNTDWKIKEFNISSSGYNGMTTVLRSSGKFGPTVDGFKLNSSNPSKMLFMYPNDDEDDLNKLRNKKRMYALINLGDIPSQKEGAAGIAVGVDIQGNQIMNGLFVWLTIDVKKKKQQPNIYIEQIVNGVSKMLVTRADFQYDDILFDENENVEIYLSLNQNNTAAKVLIGGTSIYQKQIKNKKKSGQNSNKKAVDYSFNLFSPLKKTSTFGMAAKGSMSVVLDTMQFGVSRDPENMNDLDLNNNNDKYQQRNMVNPDVTYYMGNENLLNNIASNQLIAGISQNSADNFVYTATPLGRGIKIYEVKYDPYPVTDIPEFEFTGYTYQLNQFQSSNIVGESVVSLGREEAGRYIV